MFWHRHLENNYRGMTARTSRARVFQVFLLDAQRTMPGTGCVGVAADVKTGVDDECSFIFLLHPPGSGAPGDPDAYVIRYVVAIHALLCPRKLELRRKLKKKVCAVTTIFGKSGFPSLHLAKLYRRESRL